MYLLYNNTYFGHDDLSSINYMTHVQDYKPFCVNVNKSFDASVEAIILKQSNRPMSFY